MKLIKGFGLLSFLVILSGSCFDPPEFPNTPQIEFAGIEFLDSPDPSDFDTLNLYLNFKDGDGDLGLSSSNPRYLSDPFHYAFFYQENDGKVEPLATTTEHLDEVPPGYELLIVPDPDKGKLVVFRTREKPEYSFLPPGTTCGGSSQMKYYEYLGGPVGTSNNPGNNTGGRRILILAEDIALLDESVLLVDSFPKSNPKYYQIRDTLYYTPNPNHNNIEVDFLIKDPTAPGGFREFDWYEEYCTTFDGRFTILSDGNNSVDGSLRYSMQSTGFVLNFSIQTLKLRVKIRDRDLNESNVIETPEFRL